MGLLFLGLRSKAETTRRRKEGGERRYHRVDESRKHGHEDGSVGARVAQAEHGKL